jgi:hypothetical protein
MVSDLRRRVHDPEDYAVKIDARRPHAAADGGETHERRI